MKQWFVVHTHAHGETKARINLAQQGFEPYLPVYAKQRRHARKVETVRAPLFPRYLFVHLDPEAARWRAIRSTIGVVDLVTIDNRPSPVPEGVVDGLRARAADAGLNTLPPAGPQRGDPVRILGGALADHEGLFDGLSDAERVTVLLDLLGRTVRVKVPRDLVVGCS